MTSKKQYSYRACNVCDVLYLARRDDIKRGRAKFCSRSCQSVNLRRIKVKITREEQEVCYRAVAKALTEGTLIRNNCLICGDIKTEAHHRLFKTTRRNVALSFLPYKESYVTRGGEFNLIL